MVLDNTTKVYIIKLNSCFQRVVNGLDEKVTTMTTKNTIGALVTAIAMGTINTSRAEELSGGGVVETLGGYSTRGESVSTVDALGKINVGKHLQFFGRYRVTGQWNEEDGLSSSEFSVQNIRFPDLAYGVGIVLERQHAADSTEYRIGAQHAWQGNNVSTYVLGTIGEKFVEGVTLVRYQREIGDKIFFGQLEAVMDVSYKEDFLFATERVRLGMQKDVYSIAVAADVVQTKTEAYATVGLAGAVVF